MTDREFRQMMDDALKPIAGAIWGICHLDFSDYRDSEYNYGMVVLTPHEEFMVPKTYNDQRMHEIKKHSRDIRAQVFQLVTEACEQHGIRCFVPPIPPEHQQPPYHVPFPTKECAVRSGLGWIGKSNLLITEEYGPRLDTAGFVLQLDDAWGIKVGTPVTTSRCGDCDLCVKACPWHNLKGVDWNPGVPREAQVDYHTCSEKRFLFVPKLGRKLECCKCMVWCPYGTEAKAKQ